MASVQGPEAAKRTEYSSEQQQRGDGRAGVVVDVAASEDGGKDNERDRTEIGGRREWGT